MKKQLIFIFATFIIAILTIVGLIYTKSQDLPKRQTSPNTSAVIKSNNKPTSISSSDIWPTLNQNNPNISNFPLEIISPENDSTTNQKNITIKGNTLPEIDIFNGLTKVKSDKSGYFEFKTNLNSGNNYILISATNSQGNLVEREIHLIFNSTEPTDQSGIEPTTTLAPINQITISDSQIINIINNELTLPIYGQNYFIKTGKFDQCTTQYQTRYLNKLNFSSLIVGDVIDINGWISIDDKYRVNACLITDLTNQSRYGVFVGEVKTISSSDLILTPSTSIRRDQQVSIFNNTKYVDQYNNTVSIVNILPGHLIRVSGFWDWPNNQINKVTEIKDYSLPKF